MNKIDKPWETKNRRSSDYNTNGQLILSSPQGGVYLIILILNSLITFTALKELIKITIIILLQL